MNETATVAAWLLAAYLIGGIPFGYLVGRLNGVDVRTVGSKNIGATNVFRTVGKKWGVLALVCDMLKGLLPTVAARVWAPAAFHGVPVPLAVGIVCALGHMLTPYMRFRGGKGVATSFGMLLALLPGLVGCAFALFSVLFALSHYISLGSCGAALFLGVAVWFPVLGSKGADEPAVAVLVSLIALFVIWKHRANIGRLVRGTENRIYLFGQAKNENAKGGK